MPCQALRLITQALVLAAVVFAGAAGAAVLGEDPPLDFALNLARLTTDLHGPDRRDTATVKQIGISSFNRRLPAVQPGLLLGYTWIDLQRGPAAALAPEGFYVGAAVRSALLHRSRLTVTATASYLYQRVRDSNATQGVTLEWFQPQLDLDLIARLTPLLGVRLGATYGRADVDERAFGAIDQSVSLARDAVLGGRAGLELDLGSDGQIGFMLHQAIGDGVEFYFQRQF